MRLNTTEHLDTTQFRDTHERILLDQQHVSFAEHQLENEFGLSSDNIQSKAITGIQPILRIRGGSDGTGNISLVRQGGKEAIKVATRQANTSKKGLGRRCIKRNLVREP
jgi:hypothetical protein